MADSDEEEPAVPNPLLVASARSGTAYLNVPAAPTALGPMVLTMAHADAHCGITPHMREHNSVLMDPNAPGDNGAAWVLAARAEGDLRPFVGENFCKATAMEVERWIALQTVMTKDAQGQARLSLAVTTDKTEMGFATYEQTFATTHNKAAQQNATVLLKKKFFTRVKKNQPAGRSVLHKLNDECIEWIINKGGGEFLPTIEEAHLARQTDLNACYKAHADKVHSLKSADLSLIVSVNSAKSAVKVVCSADAGDAHWCYEYKQAGDAVALPSAAYHYTAMASQGAIKVVFFYSLTRASSLPDVSSDEEAPEGASGAKADGAAAAASEHNSRDAKPDGGSSSQDASVGVANGEDSKPDVNDGVKPDFVVGDRIKVSTDDEGAGLLGTVKKVADTPTGAGMIKMVEFAPDAACTPGHTVWFAASKCALAPSEDVSELPMAEADAASLGDAVQSADESAAPDAKKSKPTIM